MGDFLFKFGYKLFWLDIFLVVHKSGWIYFWLDIIGIEIFFGYKLF
jgi:hypothetical protein